jgi:hypothetical protein
MLRSDVKTGLPIPHSNIQIPPVALLTQKDLRRISDKQLFQLNPCLRVSSTLDQRLGEGQGV